MSTPRIFRVVAVCAAALGWSASFAAEFRDLFADREVVTTAQGTLAGDNTGATVELPNEPKYGGKKPSHSLWVTWVAPENGLMTLTLTGQGFDTLLGVYQLEPGDDPALKRLKKVAANDDDGAETSSRLQFGVRAGEHYEIAVDGYARATGPLSLSWSLRSVQTLIPTLSLLNSDRAAVLGESVTLAATLGPGAKPKLTWFHNGTELEDQENLTLTIPRFQARDVGEYRVRVVLDDGADEVEFFSEAIELQVSTEGTITTLARNKPEDAVESSLNAETGASSGSSVPRSRLRPAGVSSGLTRGYDGTQIFNTVYAGFDLFEPAHCGFPASASYWFAYDPPVSGELEVNTDGSAFDTVLEVYSYSPPLLSYGGLTSLACDNDSGANGKTSRLKVSCEAGRSYLVVVDGVKGARGLTYLNYHLDTNVTVVTPPRLAVSETHLTAEIGQSLSIKAVVDGTPPFTYRWFKDGQDWPGPQEETLTLETVGLNHAGHYSVQVSNPAGQTQGAVLSLAVCGPAALTLDTSGSAALEFLAAGELQFFAESSPDLSGAAWKSTTISTQASGGLIRLPVEIQGTEAQFFRVRFQ